MSSVTSEEFLWSCELTAAKKGYTWAPEVIFYFFVNVSVVTYVAGLNYIPAPDNCSVIALFASLTTPRTL